MADRFHRETLKTRWLVGISGLLAALVVGTIGFMLRDRYFDLVGSNERTSLRLEAHVETIGHPVAMEQIRGLERTINSLEKRVDENERWRAASVTAIESVKVAQGELRAMIAALQDVVNDLKRGRVP
jgi:hypothetical protein